MPIWKGLINTAMNRVNFESLVTAAVEESLGNNKPLVVALSKEDDTSKTFLEEYVIHNQRLIAEAGKFVALKLVESSVEAEQFAATMPKMVFPAMYLISLGSLHEIITMDVSVKDFTDRLLKLCGGRQSLPQIRGDEPQTPPANEKSSRTPKQKSTAWRATTTAQAEEKARVRALIEADKRERQSLRTAGPNPPKSILPRVVSSDICALSIKLLDGSTVRHEFSPKQTLDDVRKWLDNDSGHVILPDTSTLPSFAATSQHPTTYSFHSPAIPRTTYADTEEFTTLVELGLCPRSALILKPLYVNVRTSYSTDTSGSVLRSAGSAIRRLGNAVFSFFDYGVDEAMEAVDGDQSSGRLRTGDEPGHPRDMDPSLGGYQDKNEIADDDLSASTNLSNERVSLSRSLTPKLGTGPSMSRIHTFHGTSTGFQDEDRD